MGLSNKNKMTQEKIVSEMFYKLWDTPKDKFTWHAILHDTLKKLETNDVK